MYLSEEQRSQPGCPARKMVSEFGTRDTMSPEQIEGRGVQASRAVLIPL